MFENGVYPIQLATAVVGKLYYPDLAGADRVRPSRLGDGMT